MNKDNIIEIAHPQIVCGRLLERIHRLQHYMQGMYGYQDQETIVYYVELVMDMAMRLQASINEYEKLRQRVELEDQLQRSVDTMQCEKNSQP